MSQEPLYKHDYSYGNQYREQQSSGTIAQRPDTANSVISQTHSNWQPMSPSGSQKILHQRSSINYYPSTHSNAYKTNFPDNSIYGSPSQLLTSSTPNRARANEIFNDRSIHLSDIQHLNVAHSYNNHGRFDERHKNIQSSFLNSCCNDNFGPSKENICQSQNGNSFLDVNNKPNGVENLTNDYSISSSTSSNHWDSMAQSKYEGFYPVSSSSNLRPFPISSSPQSQNIANYNFMKSNASSRGHGQFYGQNLDNVSSSTINMKNYRSTSRIASPISGGNTVLNNSSISSMDKESSEPARVTLIRSESRNSTSYKQNLNNSNLLSGQANFVRPMTDRSVNNYNNSNYYDKRLNEKEYNTFSTNVCSSKVNENESRTIRGTNDTSNYGSDIFNFTLNELTYFSRKENNWKKQFSLQPIILNNRGFVLRDILANEDRYHQRYSEHFF
ncbi:hypothetical protein TBLA_0B02080 [Henningerozyma blattae CBS 6284]|uniref:Uncharacterized protein n=1 Tax=Henningerozyma blattae (strain ATCC 34711 / CBS 6284 / DSM 70876 / NBRC 10599 / NRRL Y-10934 / UCD 77-7) TaxID=1071380 RepID=I2GY48_HENB6|nr:hypothetical protein TBLA_0B02080 [Tetrapisispora blattae CBS 6284]CCH59050.1 hypothetical protein TBLA_0B02080 [Tetrapisispora blattae CBS 6284]